MTEVINKELINTRFLFSLLLLFCFAANSIAQTYSINGKVLGEGKPLENVVVTDGRNVTVTNAEGVYTLDVSPYSTFVYLSTPTGYLPNDSLNVPLFFKPLNGVVDSVYDFELIKNEKNDYNHIVLVQADPQFFREEQFDLYEEVIDDCIETIASYKHQDVFGIDCGDLTADRSDFYSPYINILNKTGVPFYRVLGNHDMENGGRTKEESVHQFESYFGPSNYSFNRGNAHYIVLNNVYYLGRPYSYMGYIDEQTYSWIKQDLSYVPEGTLVFVAMHIPGRLTEEQKPFSYNQENIRQQTMNINPLFEILEPYNAHIFTGHEHYNKNIIHSPTLYEHNTAAISGAFWQGDYCWDGTPIGYGVYEVTGSEVRWYFKSAGHPREHQMRITPVGSSYEHPDEIIVNVWNWDKNWKVEWTENGEERGEMTQFTGLDPATAEMCADKDKLEFKWLSPVSTEHLFKATPQSAHSKVEVIATDSFGQVYIERLHTE